MLRRLLLLSALSLVFGAGLLHAAETEAVELGGGVKLEMVRISAGTFKQGSPDTEAGRNADEEQHSVEIKSDFFIGKFPVTRGQFKCFVKDTGYRTEAEVGTSGGMGWDGSALKQRKEFNWRNPGFEQNDDHPVVLVTYADAQAFCRWLERKAHRAVTLPSEAQWEYACRAGTTTRYYTGDDNQQAGVIAWFKDNSGNSTHPAGGKTPNAWGLYDMSGNVYQWCQDVYEPYRPGGAVQGDQDKTRNVLRGGSWLKGAGSVRSAARYRNTPGSRNADNGFRVVAAASKPVQATVPPTDSTSTGSRVEAPADTSAAEPQRTLPDNQESPRKPIGNSDPAPSDDGPGILFTLFLLCIPLGIAAVITWVIYSIVRSISSRTGGASQSRSLTHVRPRLVDDGFWFDSNGYNAGDLVSYSFRGPDGTVRRQFRVEPSARGQFIYTGHRPDDLELGMLMAAHQTQVNSYSSSTRQTYTRHETTSRSYPSAY